MTAEWYELLSLLMRYVFVGLGLIIVWRVFRWINRDAAQYNRDMRRLPDAGLVGELVDLESGKAYPLPREGMIGSARGCDVRIKRKDVSGRHATFIFEDGKGLRVTPYLRRPLALDQTELSGAAHALHGSVLELGRCALRVRLFAGLNVPHPTQYMRDEGGMGAIGDVSEAPPAYQTPAPYAADAPGYGYAQPAPSHEQMQMTWSYAVPPEGQNIPDSAINRLNSQQNIPDSNYSVYPPQETYQVPQSTDGDEAPAYQSPMPQRRRRRDRR